MFNMKEMTSMVLYFFRSFAFSFPSPFASVHRSNPSCLKAFFPSPKTSLLMYWQGRGKKQKKTRKENNKYTSERQGETRNLDSLQLTQLWRNAWTLHNNAHWTVLRYLYLSPYAFLISRPCSSSAALIFTDIQGELQIRILDLRVQVTKCIIWLSNQDLLN